MDIQEVATLLGIMFSITAGIIVGILTAGRRLEKILDSKLSAFNKRLNVPDDRLHALGDRLNARLNEAEARLQAGITENRQLIIKYIAKK